MGSLCPSAGSAACGEPGAEDGAHQNHRDAGRAGEDWGLQGPAWVGGWGGSDPHHGADPHFLPLPPPQQVVTESHKERAEPGK